MTKTTLFKSLLLAAGLCVGANTAWADNAYQTYLTTERGWSQVTDLSSLTLSNYYFAIVSNDNTDLMVKMGAAQSGQQDSGHSMWYMDAADPLKDNTYLWMIENNTTEGYVGYTFRNVDFSKRVIQTHKYGDSDASYMMHTNWEQTATQWSSYALTPTDGIYTIKTLANGSESYAGLWNYSNGYVSGEELAGNKSGDQIGHFLIYKISRTDALANAIAGAGAVSTSPYELGYFLWGRANKDDYSGATGTYGPWEEDHNLRVERYKEDVAPSTGDMVTRSITTAPIGSHKITVTANAAWISGRGSVGTDTPTTNDNSTVLTINGVSQNVPVRTDGTYNPVTLTYNTTITDNNISFAITNNDAAAFWFVWEVSDLYYGVLTLNAPTITKTMNADGTFDISITSDQSSLPVTPASTTIKYAINGGAEQTYSTTFNVAAGTNITANVTATGYTNSATSSISTVALPSMTQAWAQSYVGLVNDDLSMYISDNGNGTIQNGTAIDGDANYYYPAGTTTNVGFYVKDDNRKWLIRSAGISTSGSTGATTAHIYNLTKGQIVKVVGSNSIGAAGVLSKLEDYSNSTISYFVVNANGTGELQMNNGSQDVRYIYSITVYNPDNTIIGLMDCTTGFRGEYSGFQKLSAGESCHYTFINHNKGNAGSNWNNWNLAVHDNANEPAYQFAIRADNFVTGASNGWAGLSQNFSWDYFMSQMNGAKVDMAVAYSSDKKLSMAATIYTTGGDIWYYRYTSPSAMEPDAVNVTLVVDLSWMELLSAYTTTKWIGSSDCSQTTEDDKVTLSSSGGTYHYKFVNHNSFIGSDIDNWNNYYVNVYDNSDTYKFQIRADRWVAEGGGYDGCTSDFDFGDTVFDQDMNGATVDVILNYDGSALKMYATIDALDGTQRYYTYNSGYTGSSVSLSGDIKVALGVTSAFVELLAAEASPTVSGTITDCGWSTFASRWPLDLSTISGGTAYYASEATGSTVTLTSTTAVVPAGEGIMVKGTAGDTFTINVAASGTAITGNLLKGQTATGAVTKSGTDGKYHYVFGYSKSDSSEYGFYNLASDTEVAAGKAYLETTTELSGARLAIVFGDEASGIDSVKSEDVKVKGYYNLSGQRVTAPQKGLYIVNGKKVILK